MVNHPRGMATVITKQRIRIRLPPRNSRQNNCPRPVISNAGYIGETDNILFWISIMRQASFPSHYKNFMRSTSGVILRAIFKGKNMSSANTNFHYYTYHMQLFLWCSYMFVFLDILVSRLFHSMLSYLMFIQMNSYWSMDIIILYLYLGRFEFLLKYYGFYKLIQITDEFIGIDGLNMSSLRHQPQLRKQFCHNIGSNKVKIVT